MNETQFLEFITNIVIEKITKYNIMTPALFEEIFNNIFNEMNIYGFENKISESYYTNFEQNILTQTNNLSNNLDSASIAIDNNDSSMINSLKIELEKIKVELEKTQDEIYKDHLTNVYNRRWFSDKLTMDNIFTTNGVLAFIDLNDFKKINDNLGHNIGDKVLKLTALAFSKIQDTTVIRYAGDEFILFSNTMRLPQLEAELEKLLKYFSTKKLKIKDKELDSEYAKIKFSFGLVKIIHGDDVKEKTELADEKMYEDKLRRKAL